MTAIVVRIVLRYLAAALVSHGLLTSDVGSALSGDADIAALLEPAVGLALAALAEGWHLAARRLGWAT